MELFKPKKNPKVDPKSIEAAILCPVEKIHKLLSKTSQENKVTLGAAVYLSGVINYLVTELIEISGNQCKQSDDNEIHKIIDTQDISTAIKKDECLNCLFRDKMKEIQEIPKITSPPSSKDADTNIQSEKPKSSSKKKIQPSANSTTNTKSEPKKTPYCI